MIEHRQAHGANQGGDVQVAAQGSLPAIVEPDPADWEAFVLQHPQGHLLQLPPWGTLKSAFGWSVRRVAVVAPAVTAGQTTTPRGDGAGAAAPSTGQARIVAGAQVLFRSRYAVSVAYVPRGPLLSGDTRIDDMLLAALRYIARQRRAVFLRLEPNLLEDDPRADACHTWFLLRGFRPADPIQPRSSIHLDLAPPVDRLFAGFSKGHRADIRRAERRGVTVRVGSAADIETFHAIMQATGTRAEFGVHTEAYYRMAWEVFRERSRLLLAEQDGQTVAGHLVFADARSGLYLYSGATELGLKSGANHLLEWYAIQWARDQGCVTYDLWGIPDALGRAAAATDADEHAALEAAAQRDPLVGVYRFKKGFGGRIVRYLPAYDQVYLSPLYALWRRRFVQ